MRVLDLGYTVEKKNASPWVSQQPGKKEFITTTHHLADLPTQDENKPTEMLNEFFLSSLKVLSSVLLLEEFSIFKSNSINRPEGALQPLSYITPHRFTGKTKDSIKPCLNARIPGTVS